MENNKKRNRKIKYLKKYPFFSLLVLSGICIEMCACSKLCIPFLNNSHNLVYANESEVGETAESEEKTKEETTTESDTETSEENEIEGNTETNQNPKQEEETLSQKDAIIGITKFKYYQAQNITSPYYQDPGKIALTTEYPYTAVDDSYFSDAAFIGDSRTIGLYDYSGLAKTDFFCDDGFCTYLWKKGKKVMYQNSNQEVLLEHVMDQKKYKKIYIMLGLNDCGYGSVDDFQKRYQDLLTMIHSKQPDAIIYLLANLKLSKEKSDADTIYNNEDVNAHNVAIAELADGVTTFYLDSNSMFTDSDGDLEADLTFDGVHLYADGYQKWMCYFKEHAVVR